MAEWEDIKGDESCFVTAVGGHRLKVWYGRIDHTWRANYPPVSPTCGVVVRLKSDEPESAKLEALTIVGEWAKALAVEAAELRGRMVGETMNAEASPWDFQTMVVCEICGNKRCPHATDAKRECTGSNEPGQIGNEPATPGEG